MADVQGVSKIFSKALKAGLVTLGVSGCAHTDDVGSIITALDRPDQKIADLTLGPITSQPIGHYDFCKAHFEVCGKTNAPVITAMSNKIHALIKKVNTEVNSQFSPKLDIDNYGVEEYWAYPNHAADCEDYVLEKRKRLIEEGISPASLLLSVVKQSNGEDHLVLTFLSDKGGIVLDNLNNELMSPKDTGYKFVKVTDPEHSGQWLAVVKVDANSKPIAPTPA